MTRVLLTGGSGFLGAHVLKVLLARGYEVVTTVRSAAKGDYLVQTNPGYNLSYVIVKDIAEDGAFDQAVQVKPPIDAVIHTASPFHYKVADNRADLLDPAIKGTYGILKAIKTHAQNVRRVVMTSSIAAMFSAGTEVYSEQVWNPVTWEEALVEKNPLAVYRASKKFAEKAAWDFVRENDPRFDLVAINPPLIYGPFVHELKTLEELNTSNVRILDLIRGGPPRQSNAYVDVRDVAEAHVRALEVREMGGRRCLVAAGVVNDQEMIDVLRRDLPQLKGRLTQESKMFDATFKLDNTQSKEILGQQYRSFEVMAVDLAKQLLELGA